jgi:hypothetical protein
MTFVSKQCTRHQCSNNINKWMTFVFIMYEPLKNKFHTTLICQIMAHEVCDVGSCLRTNIKYVIMG